MILNLAAAFLAASSVNGATANRALESVNEANVSEICVRHAIDEGYASPSLDQNAVTDLSGNIFLIEVGEETGFMIIDPVSQLYIESTPAAESPYDFSETRAYYYFGPWNYYYALGKVYVHCLTGDVITKDQANSLQDYFDERLAAFRESTSDEAYAAYRNENPNSPNVKSLVKTEDKIYIDNYEIIRDSVHPENLHGSCGFVAASIVLNYYDKTVSKGIVASQFKDDSGELITTKYYSEETNLKDKLVAYNNGVEDSFANTVSAAVNKYCADYGVHGQANWHLLTFGVASSIQQNKPAIIFGSYPRVDTADPNDKCNHAVTVYGYDKRWWTGYCVVNYGWGQKYSETSICILWWTGMTMTFDIDEGYYEQSHLIGKNEYGFPDAYVSTDTTNSITTADRLTFETNRLRCGFIHDEYVTISPRKSGYGTAYIEYVFTNPIREIEMDISYWSIDERYESPNRSELKFQYKGLMSDDWDGEIDLLTENISTDRNAQTHMSIAFPKKTRTFRIYAHFSYMQVPTDRNKGRVSIGDITVKTYR